MLRTHTGRDLGDSQELSVVLLLLESVSHPLVTVPGVTLRCGDCLHCARARAILGVPMRHAGPSGALNGDVQRSVVLRRFQKSTSENNRARGVPFQKLTSYNGKIYYRCPAYFVNPHTYA